MSNDSESEVQEEIKPVFSYPWRVFGFEIILFCLSMVLGILAGFRLNNFLKIQKISPPPISLPRFFGYFLLGTFGLVLLIYFFKFKKGKGAIFKLLFILAIGLGNLLFFGLWLALLPAFILVAALILFLLKKPCLIAHNLALSFAAAGIGAGLGLSFQPEIVLLLLLIFSVYDFIAVYQTKHMVKMAKEMIEHRAMLGFIVPQKISDFKSNLKGIKLGGKFLILGGGDVVFPLILVVSLIPQGVWQSIIVAFFSLIGLLVGFLIFISQLPATFVNKSGGERAAMPALPPIALFAIIGYLLTRII